MSLTGSAVARCYKSCDSPVRFLREFSKLTIFHLDNTTTCPTRRSNSFGREKQELQRVVPVAQFK